MRKWELYSIIAVAIITVLVGTLLFPRMVTTVKELETMDETICAASTGTDCGAPMFGIMKIPAAIGGLFLLISFAIRAYRLRKFDAE